MLSTSEIVRLRPQKHAVDPLRPHSFFLEKEPSIDGTLEDVATILLVGKECLFHCLMCDLWKNTLATSTPKGAIVEQIDFALDQLPAASALKLYNSSNFFDPLAVPVDDYAAISERARRFSKVIVENHPRLCGENCREFKELLGTCRLEVAMGLETVHPQSLRALNKQMSVQDFEDAVHYLLHLDIGVRAFVLLRLPGMSQEEGILWAVRSLQAAFAMGVQTCSVIPTRSGNGAIDVLESQGTFTSASLTALEQVLDEGLQLQRGRVFADLWDVQRLDACAECREQRIARMRQMNLSQRVLPRVSCAHCSRAR